MYLSNRYDEKVIPAHYKWAGIMSQLVLGLRKADRRQSSLQQAPELAGMVLLHHLLAGTVKPGAQQRAVVPDHGLRYKRGYR